MKKYILLTSSIALTFSSLSNAQDSEHDNYQLDLNLRTFYMNRDFSKGIPDTDAGGQAFNLNFKSPYYGNLIGINASATHVAKLRAAKKQNLSGVLAGDGDSYSKVEDLYLKIKPLENINIKAGRMVIGTPLLNSERSRLAAGSIQGLYGNINLENFNAFVLYSDEASSETSQDFTAYSANGADYSIRSIGGGYNFDNGAKVFAQFANAENYLSQAYYNVSYPTKVGDNDFTMDLVHMRGSDDGNLYGSNYDSNLTSLTGRLTSGNWAYTINYQTIGGSNDYQQKWGGQDNTQFYTYGAVQFSDFNAKDEQSLQLRIDYDLPSIPGLHLMARHTQSWDVDYSGGNDGKRHETNFDAKYTIQSGKAKDVSLQLRVAHVNGDQIQGVGRVNDIRFILDVPVSLF